MDIEKKLEKVVSPTDFHKIKKVSIDDQEEFARLQKLIDNEARGILMAKEKIDGFNTSYDELQAWLNDVILRHGKLASVAVDADVVKEQLREHQVSRLGPNC